MTDAHLWADTYDRKLTDIFAVESEIAKTIAETLQARLTGCGEKLDCESTDGESGSCTSFISKARFFSEQADRRGFAQIDRLFQSSHRERIRITLSLMSAWPIPICFCPAYGAVSPRESIPPAKSL